VLFEKNADQSIATGGFACLMTAEIVFDALAQGRIKLDDQFEITENAWRKGGAPSHTSSMFAPIHSKVRVEDLLRGAIVQSGNDACIAA
jgi:D-alanyl-D-alanine carboxypeptidase (penicillin-binding protein 5/6)